MGRRPPLLRDGLQPADPRVDITDTIADGIDSHGANRAYLDGLGRDLDPAEFLHAMTLEPGRVLGVCNAVALGRVQLQDV